ncbi:hypothetical protein TNIN_177451 [Trichonephila inaurata madagascariensis]|uniref:Uncharacterized protein n=1 Tax=Trichonephila inaurata madagascariensis TaxID=2747483 RepID=A0A8X6YME4_9ARAC|nr:hypothetical protein TNIN_177451 [Trichonephila inaurata madagascariensis]
MVSSSHPMHHFALIVNLGDAVRLKDCASIGDDGPRRSVSQNNFFYKEFCHLWCFRSWEGFGNSISRHIICAHNYPSISSLRLWETS